MDDITIREIQESDLEKGFLESLDNLKKASDLDKGIAKNILNIFYICTYTFYLIVYYCYIWYF